jgi:polysaccharide export outer membrane protein
MQLSSNQGAPSGARAATLRQRLLPLVMATAVVFGGFARADDQPYQIQAGDVLFVSVWKEAELQSEVLVRSDGGISFALAGDLKAAGLSVAELSEQLAARIKKYIPDPVVTVAIKVNNGNRIYVVGKVNRPGEFPYGRPIDVMQAIALASGTTPYAALSDIRILRRENGKLSALRFDYTDVERGKSLESNIVLRSGDTVVVP